MKLATPGQMNSIDSHAIHEIGIPGMVLMENAALKVAEAAAGMLGALRGRHITILAGKGNNGGDAFAAARHLCNRGALCSLFLLSERSGVRGDAAANLDIAERMGLKAIELIEETQLGKLKGSLQKADLVIDGIFGTGLKGEVGGVAAAAIEAVNRSSRAVLSIDIPSGISGETGKVLGCAIKADRTVTFCLPKVGLAIHPGCEYAGKLDVADIGIPESSIKQAGIKAELTDGAYVSGKLAPRRAEGHKGDYGKLLLLTGSTGMAGSGCLCANAALRTGAGLVYLGVPSSLTNIYNTAVSEAVVLPLEDGGSGRLSSKNAAAIPGMLKNKNVVAAGPGLSALADMTEIAGLLVKECRVPLILDADALNALSRDIVLLKKLKTEAVVTPHPTEMARLAGLTTEEVTEDRIGTARNFSQKWRVITVLKGSRTVIALPDGSYFINPTGNPGMATGGSGDILTGIIASLAGQGMKLADAAVAGVYLHGLAGDRAAERTGMHGLLPRDVVDELPAVMKEVFNGGYHGI